MTARLTLKGRMEKTGKRRGARNLPIWRVTSPYVLEYQYQGAWKRITLGIGAWIDGISSNWFFRAIIYLIAGNAARISAGFHDLACQSRALSKDEADAIFAQAMETLGVPKWLRRRINNSVGNHRNNWEQPELSVLFEIDGYPGMFVECPIEFVP